MKIGQDKIYSLQYSSSSIIIMRSITLIKIGGMVTNSQSKCSNPNKMNVVHSTFHFEVNFDQYRVDETKPNVVV